MNLIQNFFHVGMHLVRMPVTLRTLRFATPLLDMTDEPRVSARRIAGVEVWRWCEDLVSLMLMFPSSANTAEITMQNKTRVNANNVCIFRDILLTSNVG